MKTAASIIDWQKRFRAQPLIWCVMIRDPETGMEDDTGHVYESKEAAELELAFRGGRGRVISTPIHSLELSRERWVRP